ncbi:DUF805 domain-containing protein [Erythrobacter sp. JK5]|uniref:DUF805 domain-containing protein n=1 Tax=Erythrobacter sp. JK5 TaxID=2829500 RepID=UPI001BAB5E7D|nr:DUF805 domain-containing protein [Erythrobacter sp. JK5]QUL38217.1 DUF805 domain-containing protein [Erythrobacter sp. JK5]
MHWMILPFKRYADFQGRSRRMEFWMFQVLNLIVAAVTVGPAIALAPATTESDYYAGDGGFAASGGFESSIADSPLSMIFIGLYGLYALAALIPSIAVTVRRFHDRDMSGWWYLGFIVMSLIPLIGIIASIALLVIMFLPGTAGPNRFGPDPKDPYDEEVFA